MTRPLKMSRCLKAGRPVIDATTCLSAATVVPGVTDTSCVAGASVLTRMVKLSMAARAGARAGEGGRSQIAQIDRALQAFFLDDGAVSRRSERPMGTYVLISD